MTKLQIWINAERGRASALATRLKVSRSRISQITEDGVPTKYMLAIRDFTDGEVTLEDMVASRTPGAEISRELAQAKEATNG